MAYYAQFKNVQITTALCLNLQHLLSCDVIMLSISSYKLINKINGKKLDIRNISEMREDLFHIVRILTFSPKEDLSKYIPKSYYSINEDSYDILGNVFNEKFIPKLSILKEVTSSPDDREIRVSIKQFKFCIVKISDVFILEYSKRWFQYPSRGLNTGPKRSPLS